MTKPFNKQETCDLVLEHLTNEYQDINAISLSSGLSKTTVINYLSRLKDIGIAEHKKVTHRTINYGVRNANAKHIWRIKQTGEK